MNNWVLLFIAVISEVVGTTALKQSEGFTKLWPSLIVVGGYGLAFYLLALTLRTIPIGVAYAVWAGLGITLITLVGWIAFEQKLPLPALAGIGLIVSGVVVLNLYSKPL